MELKVCQKTIKGQKYFGLKDENGNIILEPQFEKIIDYTKKGTFVHARKYHDAQPIIWRVVADDVNGLDITKETIGRYPKSSSARIPYNAERLYFRDCATGDTVIFNDKSLEPMSIKSSTTNIQFGEDWVIAFNYPNYSVYSADGDLIKNCASKPRPIFPNGNVFTFLSERDDSLTEIMWLVKGKQGAVDSTDEFRFVKNIFFYKPVGETFWKAIGEKTGSRNLLDGYQFKFVCETAGFLVGLSGNKFTVLNQKDSLSPFEWLSETSIEGKTEEELKNYYGPRGERIIRILGGEVLFSISKSGVINLPHKDVINGKQIGRQLKSGYSAWFLKEEREILIVDEEQKELRRVNLVLPENLVLPSGDKTDCFVDEKSPTGEVVSTLCETDNHLIVQSDYDPMLIVVKKNTGEDRWIKRTGIGSILRNEEQDCLLDLCGYLIDLREFKSMEVKGHLRNATFFSYSRDLGMLNILKTRQGGRFGRVVTRVGK